MRCSRGAAAFEVCQRPQRVPAVAAGIQQQSYEAGKKWLDIPADQRELADQTGLAQVRAGRGPSSPDRITADSLRSSERLRAIPFARK